MPIRRCTDPIWVQRVWDAVRSTLHQRQQTDMVRLSRYLQRTFDLTAIQAEGYTKQVLQDNMIISVTKTGQKGTKLGLVTETFRIPSADNSTPLDDGHDWYCIECHLAGDVICCTNCHRVFHQECQIRAIENRKEKNVQIHISNSSIDKTNENDVDKDDIADSKEAVSEENVTSSDGNNGDTVCSVCHLLQTEKECIIGRDELNYLLNFTLNRIKIWLPPNITDSMDPKTIHPWSSEQEHSWRARHLLYQTMDIRIMDMKLRMKEYTKLAEFHADVITIQHNVAIFHGLDSQEMQGSILMIEDCKYDLVELAQCVDCYRHSNEKFSNNWFCIPCKTPHILVWAKQKGYPYWPAKVIKITNNHYDVRFFGAKHLRAFVDKNFIKPIETSIQSLQIKRTQAFNKAMQELAVHQNFLINPDEATKLLVLNESRMKRLEQNEKRLSSPKSKSKPKAKKNKTQIQESQDNDVYEFPDSPSDSISLAALSVVMEQHKTKKNSPIKNKTKAPKSPKKIKKSLSTKKFDISISQRSNGKDYDVIDLSDMESKNVFTTPAHERHDYVSSSTENMCSQPKLSVEKGSRMRNRRGSSGATQQLDRPYSDSVEKLRRHLEIITEREEMICVAMDTMQQELDKCQNVHSEHLRSMVDAHNVLISEIKKKQWCYNCEQEAIYHCCWNTAYCSTLCQQQHWQSEHKKVCRRKR